MNRTPDRPLVESCCTSVEEAFESAESGADRIELCQDLTCGGLTPDVDLLKSVVARVSVPIFVLIRPREGDFVYAAPEIEAMRRSIETAGSAGAAGVVLGALTSEGSVELALTAALVRHAKGMSVTFHKAIDEARDMPSAFEACGRAGIHRILSSGGEETALAGAAMLGLLNLRPGPIVMAGGGVRLGHVQELVLATGVPEVHARAEAIGGIIEALSAGTKRT